MGCRVIGQLRGTPCPSESLNAKSITNHNPITILGSYEASIVSNDGRLDQWAGKMRSDDGEATLGSTEAGQPEKGLWISEARNVIPETLGIFQPVLTTIPRQVSVGSGWRIQAHFFDQQTKRLLAS